MKKFSSFFAPKSKLKRQEKENASTEEIDVSDSEGQKCKNTNTDTDKDTAMNISYKGKLVQVGEKQPTEGCYMPIKKENFIESNFSSGSSTVTDCGSRNNFSKSKEYFETLLLSKTKLPEQTQKSKHFEEYQKLKQHWEYRLEKEKVDNEELTEKYDCLKREFNSYKMITKNRQCGLEQEVECLTKALTESKTETENLKRTNTNLLNEMMLYTQKIKLLQDKLVEQAAEHENEFRHINKSTEQYKLSISQCIETFEKSQTCILQQNEKLVQLIDCLSCDTQKRLKQKKCRMSVSCSDSECRSPCSMKEVTCKGTHIPPLCAEKVTINKCVLKKDDECTSIKNEMSECSRANSNKCGGIRNFTTFLKSRAPCSQIENQKVYVQNKSKPHSYINKCQLDNSQPLICKNRTSSSKEAYRR